MNYSRRGYIEKKCYRCGKNIVIADQWVYKMHIPQRVYFCTYGCMTKFKSERKERRKKNE